MLNSMPAQAQCFAGALPAKQLYRCRRVSEQRTFAVLNAPTKKAELLPPRQQPAETLRFGFPKGSLQNSTHELFRKAGVCADPAPLADACLYCQVDSR